MFRFLIHLIIVSLFWSLLSVGATGTPLYGDFSGDVIHGMETEPADTLPSDEGCEFCNAFHHVMLGSERSAKISAMCGRVATPCDTLAESLSRSPDGPPPEPTIA